MLSLLLALQQTAPLPQLPRYAPPTRTARCVGVDNQNRRQTMTLESRWIEAEHTSAVFVVDDSSGVLKPGTWLENQNQIYRDGDRKQGVFNDWNDESFSKRVGDRYVQVLVRATGLGSATILYLARRYSSLELTPSRYSNKGEILLAGRCSLLIDGKPV